MDIFTIGFTKKTAEQFFDLLGGAGARLLLDIRLNNVSQLAGFTKRDDLAFFTRRLLDIPYRHEVQLAPTQPLLDEYKKQKGSWREYEAKFCALMEIRRIEETVDIPDGVALLCSEPTAARCHRRLVAEYLASRWDDVRVVHL